jgi:hypothetical protein
MLGADYFAGKTGEAEVAVARPALLGANGTSSQIGAAWFWERARARRKAGRIRNEFFSDLPRRHGAKNPSLAASFSSEDIAFRRLGGALSLTPPNRSFHE